MRHSKILQTLAALFALIAVIGCAARLLPQDWQTIPYASFVIALSPWFALAALIALICAVITRRAFIIIVSIACLVLQVWWQLPYYHNGKSLSSQALQIMAQSQADTQDAVMRVMTVNVYRGAAEAQEIVNTVRDQHVEVLAMQETTDDFMQRLQDAGLEQMLPYHITSSADHVFGNSLWSASPLHDLAETEINSSASFMPAGTVDLDHDRVQVRFVSVHTTSPSSITWKLWDQSITELSEMTSAENTQYVLMGDFNATTDHAVFRNILSTRYKDASLASGHGLQFTYPANTWLPAMSGIDHIIIPNDVTVGQVQTVRISGSDHKALLATLEFHAQ